MIKERIGVMYSRLEIECSLLYVLTRAQALLLLDYCLHVGSENVVLYAKENIYVVKTLKEFQHVDETGKDVGANGKYYYCY
jgi:hypothetical protein